MSLFASRERGNTFSKETGGWGLRQRTREGLWKVTGRGFRKRTRDRHAPFQPRQLARGVNHSLAPEILAYVTLPQTVSVGSSCDAIFTVSVIGIMASLQNLTIVRADSRDGETPLVHGIHPVGVVQ